MIKRFAYILCITLMLTTLAGCKKPEADNEAVSEYAEQMENFFVGIKTLDEKINSLNPEDENSLAELFIYLEQLEEQFKYLSEIDAPDEFNATESLADEAYDYMIKANQYFAKTFEDNSYNENTYKAGLECYNRANKRVKYIISLLHGEIPTDEGVNVE